MNDKLLCFISMSLAILYCIGLITTACGAGVAASDTEAGSEKQSTGLAMEHETRIFDTRMP